MRFDLADNGDASVMDLKERTGGATKGLEEDVGKMGLGIVYPKDGVHSGVPMGEEFSSPVSFFFSFSSSFSFSLILRFSCSSSLSPFPFS